MSSEYADSAQARQTDKGYQREQQPSKSTGSESFFAACNARREAERVAFKARLATALGELETFFSEPK
jgi:hypothetical protein